MSQTHIKVNREFPEQATLVVEYPFEPCCCGSCCECCECCSCAVSDEGELLKYQFVIGNDYNGHSLLKDVNKERSLFKQFDRIYCESCEVPLDSELIPVITAYNLDRPPTFTLQKKGNLKWVYCCLFLVIVIFTFSTSLLPYLFLH